ncbi:hypothetical protein [Burkholderia multivorans]|uniref:hypothetical protein n=1 Tax=Burkholderia multivorans TaxID=87883 RepID=UPI0021BE0F2B|nr:hypothetical protein [Burkholderia multivorans]
MNATGIHIDPSIGEVFELLHRMESCRTLDPFQWMAREAIQKLRDYENRVVEVSSMRDSREASIEDRQHGR